MKKLDAILTQLPKEVADIIEAMRAKTVILENDKKLLRQENAILLANQEMLVKAHKELFEENEALKNKTKAKQLVSHNSNRKIDQDREAHV